ncbi:MAG TPA: efflux RND transporter permease subunit [Caulobacteraceae bacterium]|nr:efflux RND transporter permease subunit [Caulobacteraceae bacterium]
MNLSAPFLKRPIGTTLLTLGIAIAGAGAFFNLPVSPLPQVDIPTISVQASLPGASPEIMASSVATPLEKRLGHIADVSEMTSSSSTGSANITLQFGLDRDIDGAARDVQAAINASRVDLPATLRSNPTYRKVNPADAPIMILAMTSDTKTPPQIYDAAATIVQQRLLHVHGVGDVTIGGGSLPAVRVEMNPVALAKYQISPEDVRAALSSADANRPKGLIDGDLSRWQIYTNDQGKVAADFKGIIVAFRNGSAVRLSDVADVLDGPEDIHNLGLYACSDPKLPNCVDNSKNPRGYTGRGGKGRGHGAPAAAAANAGGGNAPAAGQTPNTTASTSGAAARGHHRGGHGWSGHRAGAAQGAPPQGQTAGAAPGGPASAGQGQGGGHHRHRQGAGAQGQSDAQGAGTSTGAPSQAAAGPAAAQAQPDAATVNAKEQLAEAGGAEAPAVANSVARPSIAVVISRQPGANIIQTVDGIKAVLPELKADLPSDINLDVAIDRTITIRASLNEVERTLLIAILLVVAVVFVFLRSARSTLIPAVAVTVSLLGTLGVMYLLKFSLDNLSLMSLTVATGFVVDDAIVVMENIARHVEAGMPRFKAAVLGASEVGFTVLSISVSLVAVFIPILLMGGIVGRLFHEFAITLSTAIIVSLAISLTTTPMMCAFLMGEKPRDKKENLLARGSKGFFDWVTETYRKSLVWALDNAPIILASLICAIGLNVYLFTIVPKGFFPTQDTGQVTGGMQSDQDSSFQLSQQRMRRFVNIVARDPAVDTVVGFEGGSRSAGGFVYMALKPRNKRGGDSSEDVINRLRPQLARVPGATLFLNPVQDLRVGGRQSNATYQYTLEADDQNALKTWSDKLTEQLKTDPDLTDVNSDSQDHGLSSYVTVDRDTANRLGLSATQIDNILYDVFGQRQAAVIYNPLNQYHVVMEGAPQFIQEPSALGQIYVPVTGPATSPTTTAAVILPVTSTGQSGTPSTVAGASTATTTPGQPLSSTGTTSATPQPSGPAAPPTRAASQGVAISGSPERMVPLSAFAHWTSTASPTSVRHQDISPAITISFNLAPGKSLSDATKSIAAAEDAISMPVTVHGSFQGTAKVYQQSLANEPMLILFAILAVYIVLGILYESYIHPWTVLSTLPSAGLGAVLALIIFHSEFSIIAMIGIVLLIGIVKKNAILIIDFALEAERTEGLSSRDAVYKACLLRFRPILMTTCAAALGALPLAIGWGEGAELRRPLGITIIGGLLVSQVLTLLTTPVVYLYLDRFRKRSPDEARLSRHSGGGPAPFPAPAE